MSKKDKFFNKKHRPTQYKYTDFARILRANGFQEVRQTGSHVQWSDGRGRKASVPRELSALIARQYIRDYNLEVNV